MIKGEEIKDFANLLIVGALALRRSMYSRENLDEYVEAALEEVTEIAISLERIGLRLLADQTHPKGLQ